MKNLLRNNIPFFGPYLLFLAVAGYFLISYPKPDIHRYINNHYHTVTDYLFQFFTWAGDGLTGLGLFIVLLAFSYRKAILAGVSMLASAGITQLLKHTLFSNEPRPVQFFAENNLPPLRHVPGVENMFFDSFPSGHTTQAFAMCLSLCFFIENRLIKFLLFITAISIGYSRMYLSQHFLRDVFAGSLVGTTVTTLIFILALHYNWPSQKLETGFWRKKSSV